MISAIIIIVGISLLILIHEAGHFWAAKAAGLRVDEFGFGFPPRMFSKKIGETTYSFNWLPFGGFVKIYGERAEVEGVRVVGDVGSVGNENTNPTSAEGAIEQSASRRRSNLSNASRSFANQKARTRLTIIAAGVAMNFLLGWLLLSLVFMVGAPQAVVITGVGEDSPAAQVGVLSGDRVIGYSTAPEFVSAIDAHKGKDFQFSVKRGDQTLVLTATPRTSPKPGEGSLGVLISEAGFPRLPFFASLWEGLKQSLQIMAQIFITFGQLIAGFFVSGEVLENVVGPVGIFGVANQLGGLGLIYLMQLLAMISLNLAVLNIIPFPALDGGRFLFILIEKIKGSPIAPKKELVFNLVGFVLLLLLMAVITTRDIIRLF